MSEKEVAFVDLTAEEARDAPDHVDDVPAEDTAATDTIDVTEVQTALEQVDLDGDKEKEEPGEELEGSSDKPEDVEKSHDEPEDIEKPLDEPEVKEEEEADISTETTKAEGTSAAPIDLTEAEEDEQESAIAQETKEVLEMTEDGDVDEEEVDEAVEKELEETAVEKDEEPDFEEDEEKEATLEVPATPKSESSFGDFASEDEFGDFDDFEEMEEPAEPQQQPSTLDTSREETPMASQTNLSLPQASVSVKSVLTDDSFSSFTSLSFAAKSVLEDNGLTQTFAEAKEPAGQKFELSESASQIYALLCSVPNSELNFLKSFTRRLLLKDVGVPLDLDELLPRKEKQHFVIRRSRRSLDKASKSRDSTDKPPSDSRAATPTPTATDSSRAQTPVTVDTELKLDSWLRLVEIRPEQRERMEPAELEDLVKQFKAANIEAKLLLKQWEDKLALGYKNKEAFEAVVENMVGFAQKQRLKKGGKKK
ncbi:hypothetical protein CJU89_4169 [Yarrowia sp. B02]|nr:hypothetical protein CJU89_4169 [Yarrowia sp. B02]